MAREAIRPRRRDLTALDEMPRRPDPQRARRQWRRSRRPQDSRATAAPATAPAPRREIRAARGSARCDARSQTCRLVTGLVPRRCRIAADTSATVTSSRHQRVRLALALIVAVTRAIPRHHHVVFRPRAVALRIGRAEDATTGVPTAPPRCNGPVSPETSSDAARASAMMSGMVVAGASRAAPFDASTTARRSPLRPAPTARSNAARGRREETPQSRRTAQATSACWATPRRD